MNNFVQLSALKWWFERAETKGNTLIRIELSRKICIKQAKAAPTRPELLFILFILSQVVVTDRLTSGHLELNKSSKIKYVLKLSRLVSQSKLSKVSLYQQVGKQASKQGESALNKIDSAHSIIWRNLNQLINQLFSCYDIYWVCYSRRHRHFICCFLAVCLALQQNRI